MTAKTIDISLCPTSLEYNNGDTYDTNSLLDAMREFIAERHPNAKINLQIGHRQGDAWSLVDGDADAGSDLVGAFFADHGTDEELFLEPDEDADQTIEIEANESAELLGLSLDDCSEDEPYLTECVRAWWDAFYAEVGTDDRLSGVEFVRPRGNRLMLPQWNGARFAWKRAVLGSFSVPTQEQQDAIDAARDAAAAVAAEVWSQIQAELAATADETDEMSQTQYEIGGLSVLMTPDAAERWNAGIPTSGDLRDSIVSIPESNNQSRQITLLRAWFERLEPAIAAQLDGMPANRTD